MTRAEIHELLTTLMRGIDKKTALTLEYDEGTEHPGATVHLSRDKRTASVRISEADLVASQTGLMERNRVRTALKRAHNRMWEEPGHIFSTKTERHALEGATHFFRPMQGGRGRR